MKILTRLIVWIVTSVLLFIPFFVHAYMKVNNARQLSFTETNRVVIAPSQSAEDAPITIIDRDAQIVQGKVVVAEFEIENQGNQPILFAEHVLPYGPSRKREIKIRLGDSAKRILGSSCSKQPSSTMSVALEQAPNPTELLMQFDVLNPGDGSICKIIFEGSKNTEIGMFGSIGIPDDKK